MLEVLEKLVKVFFSFSFRYYEHGEVENFADCRSTCEQNNRQLYMGSTTLWFKKTIIFNDSFYENI